MYSSLCPVIFITDDVALNFFSSESDCLGTDKTVQPICSLSPPEKTILKSFPIFITKIIYSANESFILYSILSNVCTPPFLFQKVQEVLLQYDLPYHQYFQAYDKK